MNNQSIVLADTFAVLTPKLQVKPVKVTPSLYQELDESFSGFAGHVLVSMHEFGEDWPTWEKHPAGDEIVMLLAGKATMILRTDGGDERIELSEPGTYVVVPRDTWHTGHFSERTKMLFMTPGEGTQNRETPESAD